MKNNVKKVNVQVAFFVFLSFFIIGCYSERDDVIPLLATSSSIPMESSELKFGVYNELTPLQNFLLFNEMTLNIEETLNLKTQLMLRKSYSEFYLLLEENELDFAYVYLDDSNIEKFSNDYSIYFSPKLISPLKTIIVSNDLEASDISILKNSLFSYTEPNSISSKMVDNYLIEIGENRETFFENYYYSFFVDESLLALQSKIVKAISIDSLNYEILMNLNSQRIVPIITEMTIIEEFDVAPIPVILINNNLKEDYKEKLIYYFRNFPNDKIQLEIAEKLQIVSFNEK
ncbi:hypothetical protein BKP35_08545 [Anaerobacillus arseniciselenatis]|uniref:Uncharacterized protein n=1 Tax=Anaerobacillus arseniciselenatis TaxID=85682 RepID=A0A1S2LN87_9BACI|nr:PhnD/SsuA/transferrin family substrate-binding protein [Anaerobacillus arseniciselenatis]OIJ13816.1 hypothetical protein BKP35_08545 [Anaerobacillus arseniciselenatis]